MPNVLVVVGFGPGISAATAERFGREGFSVALIARNEERLADGVRTLQANGLTAAAFAADAADPAAIRAALAKVRAALGPITVIHWNAYNGGVAGNLMATTPADVRGVFDIAVVGLLAAVQEALPDLKQSEKGAVLVTNGAYGENVPQIDAAATKFNVMGLALANAAKHKLVGLLAQALNPQGIYVGEVMVAGGVKGTATGRDDGIEAPAIADTFWRLYSARGEIRARVS